MKDLEVKEADSQHVKTVKTTDLQKFINKFQPSKFKQLKNGIEIRSVQNIEEASFKASSLI